MLEKLRALPRHLQLLLAASAILLAAWSFAVPAFEAPDELAHWDYARYIHDHWRLPPYEGLFVEANQPPLYYSLIAPVSAEEQSPKTFVWADKGGGIHALCPPRIYKHCASDFEKFWPLRWARLITVVFSILTVFFTYLAGYEANANPYTALLAASFVAFLPQFTFRGTNVSNDAMVATTSALATYFVIRLIRRDFSWKTGYLAAFSVGLAFLSKISAIIFFPIFIATLVLHSSNWLVRAKRLTVLWLPFACTAPWLIRNQILYGDPLASRAMLTVVPSLVVQKSISSPYFIHVFPAVLAKSFVGVFGSMNVYLPNWIYDLSATIALIGVAGFLYSVLRRSISKVLALTLILLPLFAIASTIELNLTFTQPQGRYLFPALTPFMLLLAIGFTGLPKWSAVSTYVVVAVCASTNLYALLGVEFPAYWTAKFPLTQTIVSTQVPSNLMLGGPIGPLRPGDRAGQTFLARAPNLSAVEIEVATYSKRIPVGFVKIHLRSSTTAFQDIASTDIPAADIADNSFIRLAFAPIPDSQGKSFYFFLETHEIPATYPVTVYTSSTDVYPDGQFFFNSAPTGRDTAFRVLSTIEGRDCTECR